MLRRLTLACVLVVLVNGPVQAQIPLGQHLLPTRSALGRLGLERNWMAVVPLGATERLLSINLSDTLVFAQTSYGNFHAYDAESGQYLWTTRLGQHTGEARPASANSYAVFATNSNKLYALDRRSGRPIWIVELPGLPTSPTACDEHRVLVGLQSGKVYAYLGRLQKIKVAFRKGELEDYREEFKTVADVAWNWQTEGIVTGRPLPSGPVVAFGSLDGKAYVAQSDAPVMLYQFAAAGPITASLAPLGTRTLLIPSVDKNVYAVDLWTAETKWVHATGSPVEQEPLVAHDNIYVVNDAGILSSLDPDTGASRWSVATHDGRLIAIGKARVYLESHDRDLFIVDRATGQMVADPRSTFERAGLNLREYSLCPTNSLNDRLYFGTRSGLVVCIREIGEFSPQMLRDPKGPIFGYVPPEGINLSPAGQPRPSPDAGATPPGENAAPEAEKKEAGEEKEKVMPKEEDPK